MVDFLDSRRRLPGSNLLLRVIRTTSAFGGGGFSGYQFHGVRRANITADAAANASMEIADHQIAIHFQSFHPAAVDADAAADAGIVVYVYYPVGDNELAGPWRMFSCPEYEAMTAAAVAQQVDVSVLAVGVVMHQSGFLRFVNSLASLLLGNEVNETIPLSKLRRRAENHTKVVFRFVTGPVK